MSATSSRVGVTEHPDVRLGELVAEVRHEVSDRAEQPGRRRHEHGKGTHELGHSVCVQRPGTAVGDEREVARIVAALHRDEPQGTRHVLVHDRKDALGGLLDRVEAHRIGDLLDGGVGRGDVQRSSRRRAGSAGGGRARRSRRSRSAPRHPCRRRRGRARRRPTAGPTRSAFVSSGTCAIEPPPAPTVWTLTAGTLIRKWPIEVSRPIVGSPSWQSATSVEVPPMSNVRMSLKPAFVAT